MIEIKISIPKRNIEAFCKRYQAQRLALFGSVARDDFRPESDIDVLVAFEPDARVTFKTLGRMKRELTGIFQQPVDVVPDEELKSSIRQAILASARNLCDLRNYTCWILHIKLLVEMRVLSA